MPYRCVPLDAPAGLRFRSLGGNNWLNECRYFLAGDGSVWCREAGYAGFSAPRWLTVPPESWGRIVLGGQTLAKLVAVLSATPEDDPTDRIRKRR